MTPNPPARAPAPELDFFEWLSALDALAAAEGLENLSHQTGEECWREAYDDGLTPKDAWAEEKAAAADMGCIDDA